MRLVAACVLPLTAVLATGAAVTVPHGVGVVGALAVTYREGVLGGVHDFTGGQTSQGEEACKTCHLSHAQARSPTTRPATRPALDGHGAGGERGALLPGRHTPGPTSLICLGCHDGTVATSRIGASHAMLAGVREGFNVPDRFVWRDHPIGVPYPDNRREYHPESFVRARGVPLPEGRVECISCHDPHNRSGFEAMLVKSNRRSALCLTCHIK